MRLALLFVFALVAANGSALVRGQCIFIERLPCSNFPTTACEDYYGATACTWNGQTFLCGEKAKKSAAWDYDGIRNALPGESGHTGYSFTGTLYCEFEKACKTNCGLAVIDGALENVCQTDSASTWVGAGTMYNAVQGNGSCVGQ